MIPPTVPPFPFYIINKDIIKGSFPFRKTFHTPKLDFEARFRPPRVPADPKSRNRTTKTEPIGGVRKSVQPKLDFAARFHSLISQLDFDRPACSAAPSVPPTRRAGTEPRKRNKPKAKESFPVRRTRQFKDYSIFAPEDFKTRFQTSPSGSSESPLLSPLRHRYCQVNPPTERLNNTHGNICNQVTSVDEFRCFSAFCA